MYGPLKMVWLTVIDDPDILKKKKKASTFN